MNLSKVFPLVLIVSLSFFPACSPFSQDVPAPASLDEKSEGVLDLVQVSEELLESPEPCKVKGMIIEKTDARACGKFIRLRDGRILKPVAHDLGSQDWDTGVETGRIVEFGLQYVEDNRSNCELGTTIRVTCLRYLKKIKLGPPKKKEISRRILRKR